MGTAVLSLIGGCRSAEDFSEAADREAYAIVDAARDQLGAGAPLRLENDMAAYRASLLEASAAGLPSGLEALSLLDCLALSAANSREFQDRRESLYLQALALTRDQWEFGFQEVGNVGAFVGGDGDEARGAGGSGIFSISRLFTTGARFVLSSAVSITRDLSNGDAWSAVSDLSLGLTQPLMRGFGSRIVREPLTQAERDVVYEARRFERFRRTFAFDVASQYYRIVQSMNVLRNEEANRQSLVAVRERNEAFAQAGRLSDIQVDQARQDEFRAETGVINATQGLQESLDSFKLFLGLPVDVTIGLEPDENDPLQQLLTEIDLDVDGVLAARIATEERLDHLTVLDVVVDSERRARIAADALRVGLDLSVDAGVVSQENALLDFRGSDLTWNAALDVDLPLNILPQRNAYRSSLIALQAARRAADASRDFVIADIRDAQRQLGAAGASLQIQERAVTLAERRVESSALNLEAGRANTRDLLESQEDLLEAQNNLTRARTDYALAALALYRDMELLRFEDGRVGVEVEPLLRVRDTDAARESDRTAPDPGVLPDTEDDDE